MAWGFTQKERVDYQEVFTPIANLDSVQTIISIAAKHNLELDQMDVSTVYLIEELKEELHIPSTSRRCSYLTGILLEIMLFPLWIKTSWLDLKQDT